LDLRQIIYFGSTWVIPILIAITFHEAAHAFAAWRLGDDTALREGRVTFNPLKHVDPFGTIFVPALLLLTASPFLFGWAKPVPVAFDRLRNPRRDMALVAVAGPMTNVILAFASALLLHLVWLVPGSAAPWLAQTPPATFTFSECGLMRTRWRLSATCFSRRAVRTEVAPDRPTSVIVGLTG
jgi:Zn-dependent protease